VQPYRLAQFLPHLKRNWLAALGPGLDGMLWLSNSEEPPTAANARRAIELLAQRRRCGTGRTTCLAGLSSRCP
jgi:hypothetical protein